MKKTKRCVAFLLALFLFVTSVAPSVKAEEASDDKRIVKAEEVDGYSLLDENRKEPNEMISSENYDEDEMVTVIVEMQEPAVLDYYDMTAYAVSDEMTAGEAVSEFLTSDDAQELKEELLDGQQDVVDEIETQVQDREDDSADEFEVCAQWTGITNAIAVKVPYGMLADIQKMDQVKQAYVQHVYERPEEQDNTIDLSSEKYTYSLAMADVQEAWEKGYTGNGMLVAVLDTGMDIVQDSQTGVAVAAHEAFTNDSFYSENPNLRYDYDSMKAFLENPDNQLYADTSLQNGSLLTYENNELYKNNKVPFGFDYADWDVYTRPAESTHGIHVSGTIAGYAKNTEGEVIFSGVAPDAQILAMKVFSDQGGGAQELSLVCALEDSMVLGADIINLSLGSDNGFADDSSLQQEIFRRVEAAGVVMMTSAGNSDYSTTGNNYNGSTLSSNPDISMLSSPAIYASNLAVASMDNSIDIQSFLYYTIGDVTKVAVFTDSNGTTAARFADKEYPIYLVDGVGNYDNYSSAGFNNGYNNGKTGIALVQRGSITFVEKINNGNYYHGVTRDGEEYGVLGCFIYNNEATDDVMNMSVTGTSIPSCALSGNVGNEIAEALKAGKTVTIRTSSVPRTIPYATSGQLSYYSSWGCGPALELKPEITAPGGNVWSAVKGTQTEDGYVSAYEMMSGTSMAAPHMSGVAALVRQRIVESGEFGTVSQSDMADLISELLVSTAVPAKDEYGVYYSPRQQGAGLVNAAAAVSTPVYLSVDGKNCGKLELGDDIEKKGEYPITFNLTNVSDTDVTYDVSVVLLRPEEYTDETNWGERSMMGTYEEEIATIDLGSVCATANTTTEFSKTASLTEAQKEELSSLFENGIYVEGFVILKDNANVQPQLGLPMLAYFGDWTAAPIFDTANWFETQYGNDSSDNEVSWKSNRVGSVLYDLSGNVTGFFDLGENVFETGTDPQVEFHTENITISPNNDGYFDRVDDFILYQLRNAVAVVIEVADADTDELYYHEVCSYMPKTVYNSDYGYAIPWSLYYTLDWDGTDMEGALLPSGTNCVMTITAYGDGDYSAVGTVYDEYSEHDIIDFDRIGPREGYVEPTFNGHAMDMTGDVISFPIKVDTEAPRLENSAITVTEEDGRTYISGTVYDEDGSLASVEITPIVKRTYKEGYGNPEYAEYRIDNINPFYSNTIYDAETKTVTFKVDVTEYAHTNTSYSGENYYYDFTWEGNVVLSCGDYGANDRSYAIKVDSTPGMVLSQTSALLHPSETFALSVNDNTGLDSSITRVSSNPEVATIDEEGNVTAIAPGQTIITVSNGKQSAYCIVAVEAVPTEVLDFKLSIDHVEGLKPNGQATVKVVDLYPADVDIQSISWSVSEDEDFANDYAAGLISVEKASSDALTGTLYMTVSASEEQIPAGHAVLTVSINGVSRTMDLNWDDIPLTGQEDDLKSAALYDEQVLYTTVGQPVQLGARYSKNSLHEVGDVIFDGEGLVLDGAPFFAIGGSYRAKLVNKEGYKLPEDIKVYTVYSSDYEYQTYPGYSGITYDKETGEIVIPYAPTGAENKLRIVAQGVEATGNPAGETSGATYTKPDGLYGPFDWEIEDGTGELEEITVSSSGISHTEMTYTPQEAGVSYIKVTSKDGAHSIMLHVVAEPVKADSIILDSHELSLQSGKTTQISYELSPEPAVSKAKSSNITDYTDVIWTSFNEDIVRVDEDGTLTAVGMGTAYVKMALKCNTMVSNYVLVHVTSAGTRFVGANGQVLFDSDKTGNQISVSDFPQAPAKAGYVFVKWEKETDPVTGLTTYRAVYDKAPVATPSTDNVKEEVTPVVVSSPVSGNQTGLSAVTGQEESTAENLTETQPEEVVASNDLIQSSSEDKDDTAEDSSKKPESVVAAEKIESDSVTKNGRNWIPAGIIGICAVVMIGGGAVFVVKKRK